MAGEPPGREEDIRMTDPPLSFDLGIVSLGNRAFEGDNNCYILGLEPGATTTLIDTGVAVDDTRDQLTRGLDQYGLTFHDVDQILLTHHHADHSGLAGEIQAASDCSVYVHQADAPLVEQNQDALADLDARLNRCITEWGMPDDKQSELMAFFEGTMGIDGTPPTVTPFDENATFDLGSVTLDVVHMPGHAAGLAGFTFDDTRGRELFSGDALLPYYTPNVGGADTRVEHALAKYLDTLSAIIDAEYSRAWPGHRGPIIDPAGRATDIIEHHRVRTERILDVLQDGPATPWEVSADLFGSLSYIHILHGPGEAYAHLDHLQHAGIVEHDGRKYTMVETAPDLDSLFPDITNGLTPKNQPA